MFDEQSNLELLYLLFSRERFDSLAREFDALCVPVDQLAGFDLQDLAVLDQFIAGSRVPLDELRLTALGQLQGALADLRRFDARWDDATHDYERLSGQLRNSLNDYLNADERDAVAGRLEEIGMRLTLLAPNELDLPVPARVQATRHLGVALAQWRQAVLGLSVALQQQNISVREASRVRSSFVTWQQRQTDQPDERTLNIYAEQVAYVFFVRVMLARVLEDKGLMARLVSDGGLTAWRDLITQYFESTGETIHGESLLAMLYDSVARFYRHFFHQDVFDWFQPDDRVLVSTLAYLSRFNFASISADVLGYTYEHYLEHRARRRKGHFLTPPETVEFMLDELEYRGTAVIGRSVLDPAAGSGSFLVHASARLKETLRQVVSRNRGQRPDALDDAARIEVAERFVEAIQTSYFGMEINPFACYLAELNLFVQALDDLALLWGAGRQVSVEQFHIHNTDSLRLPPHVLHQHEQVFQPFEPEGESEAVKARAESFGAGFFYVMSNPPYIGRVVAAATEDYLQIPFWREILQGETNTWLLFLKLGLYYLADGGSLCYIIPLNLFGDLAAERARNRLANSPDLKLRRLTRFYTRTVLFEGVLQGVCVVVVEKAPGQAVLQLRGGHDVPAAARTSIQRARADVVEAAAPPMRHVGQCTPWLVIGDADAYDIWADLRVRLSSTVGTLIHGRLEDSKGEVRFPWVRPLARDFPDATHKVPIVRGEEVTEYGPLPATVRYYARSAGTTDSRDAAYCLTKIQRVADLDAPEMVVLLKEVSGLEMKRPVRGTLTERSGTSPFVADSTLVVFRTLPPRQSGEDNNQLAHALFALLSSALGNWLFALFSTNAHVSVRELKRTPIPDIRAGTIPDLAATAQCVLSVHKRLNDEYLVPYIGRVDGSVHLSAVRYLASLPLSRITLQQARDRGLVNLPAGRATQLPRILRAAEASGGPQDDYERFTFRVLTELGNVTITQAAATPLPDPAVLRTVLDGLEAAEAAAEALHTQFQAERAALDDLVFGWYGITDGAARDYIRAGVPWGT